MSPDPATATLAPPAPYWARAVRPGRSRRRLIAMGVAAVLLVLVGYFVTARTVPLAPGSQSYSGTFDVANDGFDDTRWVVSGDEAEGFFTVRNAGHFALTVSVPRPETDESGIRIQPRPEVTATLLPVEQADSVTPTAFPAGVDRLEVGPGEQFVVLLRASLAHCSQTGRRSGISTQDAIALRFRRLGLPSTHLVPLFLPVTIANRPSDNCVS